ncbi:unnamed protein product [Phytomonas sp. Hart1]|nr:unnamed protein product [Phytomonas sp. Hart1]|eukprot:CCW67324.1 unnamed protein product [Phytomonas sp. isolate Hart1]
MCPQTPLSSSSNALTGNYCCQGVCTSSGSLDNCRYEDDLYIYESKLRSCAAQSSVSVEAAKQQIYELRCIRSERRARDKNRRLWFSIILSILLWMFMNDQANRYSAMLTHLQTQEYAKAHLPVKWVMLK